MASSQCCDRLHKEKEEARINLEEALKKLNEQHKKELVQLEDRCSPLTQKIADFYIQTDSYSVLFFVCVCQIEEFLPNRVGQSPSNVSGGG